MSGEINEFFEKLKSEKVDDRAIDALKSSLGGEKFDANKFEEKINNEN